MSLHFCREFFGLLGFELVILSHRSIVAGEYDDFNMQI
jgi:hypothetical protein